MNKDYLLIIDLLEKNDTLTCQRLAQSLGVSPRTIRNYVKSINDIESDTVCSSQNGYFVNKSKSSDFRKKISVSTPQNNEERIEYILQQFMEKTDLYVYDLCEELYISFSTLNIVLNKIKARLSEYGLQLINENGTLSIYGEEKSKRRFISSIITSEAQNNFINLNALQDKFYDIDIDFIYQTVLSLLKKYSFYINDFSLNNLVLHIAISVDRIKQNNISADFSLNEASIISEGKSFTNELIASLEQKFNIVYNHAEKNEMMMLVFSRINTSEYISQANDKMNLFLQQKYVDITNDIIDFLENSYGISFHSEDSIMRFAIHIQNLFIRSKNNYYSHNPLVENIKTNCPLLYDISTSIALMLLEKYNTRINNDEIAYIAIHIGAMLEEQKNFESHINAVLYYPDYYDLSKKLGLKIQNIFNDKIIITNIISDIRNSSIINNTELIISVTNLNTLNEIPCVVINPFLGDKDIKLLNETVKKIELKKKRKELENNFKKICNEKLFERHDGFKNEFECIDYLADKYIALGYADDNFKNGLIAREQLAQTSFGRFAIPHSIDHNSYKTALNIMLLNKPVQWGDYKVDVVIMLGFSKTDKYLFSAIFEPLINILSESKNISRISTAKTYEEFISLLIECIGDEEW